LLVLQSAAHDDWIGLKEQAGHAADRVSKMRRGRVPIQSHRGEKMLRVCLGGNYIIKERKNVPRSNLLSLAGHMPELAFAND
jgi:hypothetical protein